MRVNSHGVHVKVRQCCIENVEKSSNQIDIKHLKHSEFNKWTLDFTIGTQNQITTDNLIEFSKTKGRKIEIKNETKNFAKTQKIKSVLYEACFDTKCSCNEIKYNINT